MAKGLCQSSGHHMLSLLYDVPLHQLRERYLGAKQVYVQSHVSP